MIDLQPYKTLDEALLESARSVKPLSYVEPEGVDDKKKEFLASKKNPKFQYKSPEYDTQGTEQRLRAIEVPNDTLGILLDKKREGLLLDNKIVANVGNEDIVREATETLYGIPDDGLVIYAGQLLSDIPNEETEKIVKSTVIKKSLEDALKENGLIDWEVEFSDKKLTTVYPAEKKITVCEKREFDKNASKRLPVHEVGVHALRAANGYEQPLKAFATGLQGYLSTEEGLAAYAEEITGNTDEETLRSYAGRVMAVDSVVKGLDFRQTFDRLKSYDFTDNQAWTLTLRAHRGGGFIKDHIYLGGLKKVKDFAEKDGDFKTLFVGKVGVSDVPLVRQLLEEKVLREAEYLPKFLE